MQGAQVTQEINEELTVAIRRNTSAKLWQTISLVLGVIIAAGAIISGLGRSFYVTRAEYTDKVRDDGIDKTTLHLTLEALKSTVNDQARSFDSQTQAFRDLSETVYNLKLQLAKGSRR